MYKKIKQSKEAYFTYLFFLSLKIKQTPLLQYLLPVGSGPSSKICPWWPPQFLQWYSVLAYPKRWSVFVSNTSGNDWKKDGHPEPLSYFVLDSNSFTPQFTQW